MSVTPHKEWFTVYTFQGDEADTATVQGLCEYMQEAAGNHAAALGLSIERLRGEGVAWVLARMRIMPERLPPVHARFEVETWPAGVEGLQYRRDFIVRDEAGTVLVKAVSHWVVVSLATRRAGRVPAFIAEAALDSRATAAEDVKFRLPGTGAEHNAGVFRARLADMDRNHHVNNVRYMDWIIESVPGCVRENARLADLELAFKAEAYRNDVIHARTAPWAEDAPENAEAFRHSLVREGDGKELVRARSVWRK